MTLNDQLGSWWEQQQSASVGALWQFFTRHIYMPRLIRRDILDRAVKYAVTAILVGNERFGIATGQNLETGRFVGLILPPTSEVEDIAVTDSTMLVQWEVASAQFQADQAKLAAEQAERVEGQVGVDATGGEEVAGGVGPGDGVTRHVGTVYASAHNVDGSAKTLRAAHVESAAEATLIRYFGNVKINPDRYSNNIGQVVREIIDYLDGSGAELEITLDIQAVKPSGFNDAEIRTISENARVLKFDQTGFEEG